MNAGVHVHPSAHARFEFNLFFPWITPFDETKVDIMIRWDDAGGTAGEYDVLVDGVSKAEDQRFGTDSDSDVEGEGGGAGGERGGVERVGLYVLGEGRVWFDEIYLGPDFTMGEGAKAMCVCSVSIQACAV